MQIKAVIFDIDGLMIDSERIARSTWRKTLIGWNIKLTDELYLETIGRTIEDTESLFKCTFGANFPFKDVLAARTKLVLEKYSSEGIPLKPGIIELLDFLDENHIPKAVGTSAPRKSAIEKLRIAGLLPRFSTIVCGDDVAQGKPAPDIFLEAARRLEVTPNQCVVLEDAVAGIMAAQAAGMLPVMIPDLQQPSKQTGASAFHVLPSLHEALPLLASILSVKKLSTA